MLDNSRSRQHATTMPSPPPSPRTIVPPGSSNYDSTLSSPSLPSVADLAHQLSTHSLEPSQPQSLFSPAWQGFSFPSAASTATTFEDPRSPPPDAPSTSPFEWRSPNSSQSSSGPSWWASSTTSSTSSFDETNTIFAPDQDLVLSPVDSACSLPSPSPLTLSTSTFPEPSPSSPASDQTTSLPSWAAPPDADESAWDIFPSRPSRPMTASAIRRQRQDALRRQTSSSHLREIKALVASMVQDEKQCFICNTNTRAPSKARVSLAKEKQKQKDRQRQRQRIRAEGGFEPVDEENEEAAADAMEIDGISESTSSASDAEDVLEQQQINGPFDDQTSPSQAYPPSSWQCRPRTASSGGSRKGSFSGASQNRAGASVSAAGGVSKQDRLGLTASSSSLSSGGASLSAAARKRARVASGPAASPLGRRIAVVS